jgi:hypothetical protein
MDEPQLLAVQGYAGSEPTPQTVIFFRFRIGAKSEPVPI